MTTTSPYRKPSSGTTTPVGPCEEELLARYQGIVDGQELTWPMHSRKLRLLGTGGQGAVYLGQRQGSDQFTLPVALKFFSPQSYRDYEAYEEDMGRIAQVAARVALIQHDHLPAIHDFNEQGGIRVMVMEWLDGFDLREVLTRKLLERTHARLTPEHGRYIDRVIITKGPAQPRLMPGVAIQVLRDCLAALAALHRDGIVHGDLKPSNILLRRTGNAKIIDIGSAIDLRGAAARRLWSPAYAAPEVLEGGENSPRSDLCSLGYVLIEMLAGRSPFEGLATYSELLEAKRGLDRRLPDLLPPEVAGNDLLLNLCHRLVAPDPARRFASAQAADLDRKGAADFHRQLVKGDLASEYENDIRVWLEALGTDVFAGT